MFTDMDFSVCLVQTHFNYSTEIKLSAFGQHSNVRVVWYFSLSLLSCCAVISCVRFATIAEFASGM